MRITPRKSLLALGIVVAVLALPLTGAGFWWRRTSAGFVDHLVGGALGTTGRFTSAGVADLPPPVARYFRHVLREGQPFVKTASLDQAAEFFVVNTGPGAWYPLRATQHFSTNPPAFVWDARIRIAPFVSILVRDMYVEGMGSTRASAWGLYALADQSAQPELDAGALQRYLAEAVWFPTALLPAAGVDWMAIDDRRATASMTDGESTVSLEFRFNDANEVVEMFTPVRFREADGRYVATPWRVACAEYAEREGMTIPVRCVVEWLLPSGRLPYWRGRVTDVHYEFAR